MTTILKSVQVVDTFPASLQNIADNKILENVYSASAESPTASLRAGTPPQK
jgi:hypothetical protein